MNSKEITYIAPGLKSTDYPTNPTIEDKINLFAQQTLGWQIDIADICINGKKDENGNYIIMPIKDSGFAALYIIFNYFEMIAKYRYGYIGNGESSNYFKLGVKLVFFSLNQIDNNLVDKFLEDLYKGCRCGLYHSGKTSPHIWISGQVENSIDYNRNTKKVRINPHILTKRIKDHFIKYIDDLRDPSNIDMRQNFEKRISFDYEK